VALVVKYSDNIHKGFASSLSVVISGIADMFLFKDISIDQSFMTGTFIVLASCTVFVWHTVRQQARAGTTQQIQSYVGGVAGTASNNLSTPQGHVYSKSDNSPREHASSSHASKLIHASSVTVTNRKENNVQQPKSIVPMYSDNVPARGDGATHKMDLPVIEGDNNTYKPILSHSSSSKSFTQDSSVTAGHTSYVYSPKGAIGPYVLSATHVASSSFYGAGSQTSRQKIYKSIEDEDAEMDYRDRNSMNQVDKSIV
jgi:Nucleotide-sugar transporter